MSSNFEAEMFAKRNFGKERSWAAVGEEQSGSAETRRVPGTRSTKGV